MTIQNIKKLATRITLLNLLLVETDKLELFKVYDKLELIQCLFNDQCYNIATTEVNKLELEIIDLFECIV